MLAALKNLRSRPAVQAAASNFGWLAAERAMRLVLGTAVGFWIARHLGPTQWGVLGYAMALVTLLGFIPALGLDPVIKRELLEKPAATAEVLASGLVLRLISGGLALLVVAAAVLIGAGLSGEEKRLLLILAPLLLQPALFLPDLWLQAHLQAQRSVSVQLAALAVCSAGRIGLILANAPLTAFAGMVVAEMLLGAAGLYWRARQAGLRIALDRARRDTMRALWRECWPLMFAGFAVIVYMKIDEVMLRQLAGPAAIGLYTAATRLSELWYFIPVALGSSLLPALLRARAAEPAAGERRWQQYYDLSAAVAYALSVPIALLAPWIIRLAYGEAFAAAGPILAVHIWSSVFVFLGVARGQWLVNERRQNFYLATTTAGAVVNVGLNFWLIPRWGGLGAAYATLVSYALAAWLASYAHPAVRATARMQTRALLIPVRGWHYLRR